MVNASSQALGERRGPPAMRSLLSFKKAFVEHGPIVHGVPISRLLVVKKSLHRRILGVTKRPARDRPVRRISSGPLGFGWHPSSSPTNRTFNRAIHSMLMLMPGRLYFSSSDAWDVRDYPISKWARPTKV